MGKISSQLRAPKRLNKLVLSVIRPKQGSCIHVVDDFRSQRLARSAELVYNVWSTSSDLRVSLHDNILSVLCHYKIGVLVMITLKHN